MSIGVLAILTGLVGSYAFRALLMSEPPPAEPRPQMQVVPLASADLPANREVRLGDVGLARMTQQQMIERKFPGGLVMTDPQQIIGRILKEPIKQGQPFLTTKLYLQDTAEDPGTKLRPGYRAYPLVVSPGVAATVVPDSFVDITFTTFPRAAKGNQLEIPEITITLLQGVEVLGVKMPKAAAPKQSGTLDIRRFSGNRDPDFALITLAVTPEEVQKLETVRNAGTFFISRRPKEEGIFQGDKRATSLQDLLGLVAPPPPQQQPMVPPWITEQYKRSSVQPRYFDREKMWHDMEIYQNRGRGAPAAGTANAAGGWPGQQVRANNNDIFPAPGGGYLPGGASGSVPAKAPQELGGGANPLDKLNGLKSTTDPFSESAKGTHP